MCSVGGDNLKQKILEWNNSDDCIAMTILIIVYKSFFTLQTLAKNDISNSAVYH